MHRGFKMSGKSSRDKGMRAERAIIALLQPCVDRAHIGGRVVAAPTLERNLEQSRAGGCDIIGLPWIAIEVKHQETLQFALWWQQTVSQARKNNAIPCLIYRKNRVSWKAVVELEIAKNVVVPVTLDLESFLLWFEAKVREMVK